ncbi:MAG: DNA-binding response regulator [Verrucomicrobia bacterium]|jgi:DNA-binding NarL/FixJ family response regulator|nr:MAG: DNA-binding response regulator [Verrucomicrobiota bacterium]
MIMTTSVEPTGEVEPVTIWLIEDNETFRKSLARGLERTGRFECPGSFGTAEEALSESGVEPSVVLIDVRLPGMDGIEAMGRLREKLPHAALIVLTVFEEEDKIMRAICAGAQGYLLKTAPVSEIALAIDDVLEGGSPMNSRIARRVLELFSRLVPPGKDYGLTNREKEILQQLVEGRIKKEIAALVGLSVHTVNTHMRNIYDKLQVNTVNGAVAKALRERLV